MDFFSDQLLCLIYYWFSVTCTKLVYLLDKKPDIWTLTVALLYGLFMVICFVEHFYYFRPRLMNWSEVLLLGLLCISLVFLCVCMHKHSNFIAIFLYRMLFSLVYLSWLCIWIWNIYNLKHINSTVQICVYFYFSKTIRSLLGETITSVFKYYL